MVVQLSTWIDTIMVVVLVKLCQLGDYKEVVTELDLNLLALNLIQLENMELVIIELLSMTLGGGVINVLTI
jgi:hypothetical protein